jgi:hypothetical protein
MAMFGLVLKLTGISCKSMDWLAEVTYTSTSPLVTGGTSGGLSPDGLHDDSDQQIKTRRNIELTDFIIELPVN